MLLSTTKVARLEGVTTETVRRWIRQGRYDYTRTSGGHYRIDYNGELKTIIYARVSSAKQRSSIDTQRTLLQDEYPHAQFMFDIGSGFNFKRRNFVRILEQVLDGTPVRLVSTTPDRISRSGLSFIIKVIEFYGGEVVFLEDENTPESFDVATLVSFLTSFCNSQSGKRNASRHAKGTDLPEK